MVFKNLEEINFEENGNYKKLKVYVVQNEKKQNKV